MSTQHFCVSKEQIRCPERISACLGSNSARPGSSSVCLGSGFVCAGSSSVFPKSNPGCQRICFVFPKSNERSLEAGLCVFFLHPQGAVLCVEVAFFSVWGAVCPGRSSVCLESTSACPSNISACPGSSSACPDSSSGRCQNRI